ncbi:DUF6624 domain-containing protein [Micromonospora sp. NPDC050695]|uniref:DUF6624 domain-containing protein n=2 Tax=unclassified Micromonospora TaxID=2617518 RepID=UPI0033D8CB4B
MHVQLGGLGRCPGSVVRRYRPTTLLSARTAGARGPCCDAWTGTGGRAAGRGEPRVYGTQIRCGPDGPVPATPIRDEAGVERRRADAGLPTLASYLAEMTTICAQDTT